MSSCNAAAIFALHYFHFFFVFVFCSRPEKTFQTIFSATRHDVNVQMRHALTNAIIHRDKSSFCVQRLIQLRARVIALL